VEFTEFGFGDLRDTRDIKIIVGDMVGDIPRSIGDSAENFGLETLDALDVGQAWPNPTASVHVGLRMAL
jgi:hypothetical protein